jgi:hypothetical protein
MVGGDGATLKVAMALISGNGVYVGSNIGAGCSSILSKRYGDKKPGKEGRASEKCKPHC